MFSRAVTISILALAISVVPASATIAYCNAGCVAPGGSNAGMTYASFEAVASAFTFPAAPITFISGGLDVAGIYTDTTGVTFAGTLNGNADPLALSGTALVQKQSTSAGQGPHSITISLPANTYAFGMFVTNASGGSSPNVDIVPVSVNSDWNLQNLGVSPQFFGIISATPIANLYIGNVFGGGPLQINSFVLGTQAPVSDTPEAPAFLMTGGGLLALQRLWRRRTTLPC